MRSLSRRWRGWIVWIALVSFSFSQLAVAAYVCPNANDATQVAQTAIEEGDCHRSGGYLHDPDNAQLCKAYCERSPQVKPSALIDLPDLADIAVPMLLTRFEPRRAFERADFCLPPSGGPPLYLRNCVLRN